jgi:DNA-directed RNA polymerase subunit alpha
MQSSTSILQLKVNEKQEDTRKSTFTILPLNRGYGHTMGNTLRRILLSSMKGAAITMVRFENADHEFSSIKGIKDTLTDILLVLKQIRFRLPEDVNSASFFIEVDSKGKTKDITSDDIELTNSAELVSKGVHITSITDTRFTVEGIIESGYGYLPSEEMSSEEVPAGFIRVDAIFSPVLNVAYSVEDTRVGQATDLDSLKITITTDGTTTPKNALLNAIETLNEVGSKISQSISSSTFSKNKEEESEKEVATVNQKKEPQDSAIDLSADISVLELSNRISNVLRNNGVSTLKDLTNVKISSISGAGEKAREEIRVKTESIGLKIKE